MSRSLILGPAAAASSRSTVMRTISEPALASAATWRTVESTSAVSVLVIDCTTMGAPPPTVTFPTLTATDWRRGIIPASSIGTLSSPDRPDIALSGPVDEYQATRDQCHRHGK